MVRRRRATQRHGGTGVQGNSMTQHSEKALRQQIADCTRMMVMAELLDYSGHVSARIPGTDRFLIPPRVVNQRGGASIGMQLDRCCAMQSSIRRASSSALTSQTPMPTTAAKNAISTIFARLRS